MPPPLTFAEIGRSSYGTEYTNREERVIRDFAGSAASKAIGYGDVRGRLRLPRGRSHEIIVRNVLHGEGAHNSLSQSLLMDRIVWEGLQVRYLLFLLFQVVFIRVKHLL